MTMNSWGQLLGLVGAIVLAIGSKMATRRIGAWIGFLGLTVRHLVENIRNVPVFTGNDEARERDVKKAKRIEAPGMVRAYSRVRAPIRRVAVGAPVPVSADACRFPLRGAVALAMLPHRGRHSVR